MTRKNILNVLALIVCIIATLHFLATAFYLYWTFWWYDIILHFLGGAFAALLVLWLRFFSGYFDTPVLPSKANVCRFLIVGTLVIGVGWEVFERLLGHTWSIEGYSLDTGMDIVFDTLGALAVYLFVRRKLI